MKQITLALIIAITTLGQAFAAEITLGDLALSQPVIRATPPSAKVGGGYITITNNGTEDDRLTAVAADFAGRNEIHEMAMENGIMSMTHLPDGLIVPAGETVTLKPGSFHLMFMMLKEPMTKGEERKVKLTFDRAGEIELTFDVKSLQETMEMN